MAAHLTVPEMLSIAARHGVTAGFHVWSPTYQLPPGSVADGWELVEIPHYGWDLRHNLAGREVSSSAYAEESQACAAFLQALIGAEAVPTAGEDYVAYRQLLARWQRTPWRRNPITRAQVLAELTALGVPASAYSLYGGDYEGRLCLEERIEDWRVFRCESGSRVVERQFSDELTACQDFWRRFVDDWLPTLLAASLLDNLVPEKIVSATTDNDDLTVPEVLAIWKQLGVTPTVGIHSPSHGLDIPTAGADNATVLSELPNGRWEMRYWERGEANVVGSYEREGDACAAILGADVSNDAAFASATASKIASSFADTAYEQLLYYWRLHPWRYEPRSQDELAYQLRDCGFPANSYNLVGGRGYDALTLERRLDHWRVYQVCNSQRMKQERYATAEEACSALWRRAVDDVLPTLISPR